MRMALSSMVVLIALAASLMPVTSSRSLAQGFLSDDECEARPDETMIAACSRFIARKSGVSAKERSAAYHRRGEEYRNKGDLDRAISDYSQALKIDPTFVEPYRDRGFLYGRRGKLDLAINDLNEAIRLAPKDYLNYYYRGANYFRLKNFDRAEIDYTNAISLNPNDADLYLNRGDIYHFNGAFDRAIGDYSQAARLFPKYSLAYYARGNAHRAKGEHDSAIADYSQAISLDPKLARSYFDRGKAYLAKGDIGRALADMEAFVKLEPDNVDGAAEVKRLRATLTPTQSPTPTVVATPPSKVLPSPATPPPAVTIPGQRRAALVIGNDSYRQIDRLWKARGDADAIAATLKTMGFLTTLAHDLDNVGFAQVLDRFVASLEPADTALFFFAGHGIEADGTNYLLPTDMPNVDPRQTQFQRSAYKVREIVDRIRQRSVRVAIAVIDACRDNPLRAAGQRGGATRGLGRMEAEEGEFLLFSAGPREAALDRLSDSDASPTSVFTRVFIKHLPTPGASLVDIAKRTQSEVRALARTAQRSHAQFPDYSDRIEGNFVLVR